MEEFLKKIYNIFRFMFFDPHEVVQKWRGIPYYLYDMRTYTRQLEDDSSFCFYWENALPILYDRFKPAGEVRGHYFLQDFWAAKWIQTDKHTGLHVDVGSRLDGFVAHVLLFRPVAYIDIRPLDIMVDGLEFVQSSIHDIPFKDNSVSSLSCLHVIEHVGLGRYGDPVSTRGHIIAARELIRILAPGGKLLIGTPVGRERLCFNAHRIFDPETIVNIFKPLCLLEFSLIDDFGQKIHLDASFEKARECKYGCGLFVFRK